MGGGLPEKAPGQAVRRAFGGRWCLKSNPQFKMTWPPGRWRGRELCLAEGNDMNKIRETATTRKK